MDLANGVEVEAKDVVAVVSNFNRSGVPKVSEGVPNLPRCFPENLLLKPPSFIGGGFIALRLALLDLIYDQKVTDPGDAVSEFNLLGGLRAECCFGVCELLEEMPLVQGSKSIRKAHVRHFRV
jgi:hypothetical protein